MQLVHQCFHPTHGMGILLEDVYVQVGVWGLMLTPEFPCVACGDGVLGVSTIANLLANCAKDCVMVC
jgi:hypothetical protein